MTLAVCLLTADRAAYTAQTLASYVEHADKDEYIRLHADDGSGDTSNMQIAEAAGFETVYRTTERIGQLPALLAMWWEASKRGATHILHLENDWEFVSYIPRFYQYDCMRLYGDYKSRGGTRMKTGPHIIGTKELIGWQASCFRGWEVAGAHWAGPPSITRTDILLQAAFKATRFKDLCFLMQRLATIRPVQNIVYHIGEERTPEGIF